MFEVAAPLWLGLLAPLVAAIWWLHRFREQPARSRVSALFLWQDLRQPLSQGSQLDRADPIWQLRALIAALLLVALSGTVWLGTADRQVTVWFDDSLSMQVTEATGVRWSLAASALVRALREAGVQRADIRSLTRPGQRISLSAEEWDSVRDRLEPWFQQTDSDGPRQLPALPLEAGEHWLVTDAASADLARWLAQSRVERVIQSGTATENSAVTRLGLRRSLGNADRLEGLVQVWNGGRQAAERRLQLSLDGQPIEQWRLSIPPAESLSQGFTVPLRGNQLITARLLADSGPASDHLAQDDQLAMRLSAARWRPRVRLSGDCGSALRGALDSLPGVIIDRAGGTISVGCSAIRPTGSRPALWFPPQVDAGPVTGPLRWSPLAGGLRRLILDPAWLRSGPAAAAPGAQPLLLAGEQPLMLRHPGPAAVLEVRLEMASSPFIRQPAYPLLLSGLLELATGQPLLEQIQARQRDPGESRIAPLPLPAATAGSAMVAGGTEAFDPGGWLILLAIGLLLYDIGRISIPLRRRASSGGGEP